MFGFSMKTCFKLPTHTYESLLRDCTTGCLDQKLLYIDVHQEVKLISFGMGRWYATEHVRLEETHINSKRDASRLGKKAGVLPHPSSETVL